MMLWKNSVGKSSVDCSRVVALDRRGRVDQKTLDEQMEDEGVKYRQTIGVGETEHTVR